MNEEIEYVKKSQYRLRVFKCLEGEVKMPSVIARETNIVQNHMSKVLNQLMEHDLIQCINPEAKKGRIYRMTEKGEELVKYLD